MLTEHQCNVRANQMPPEFFYFDIGKVLLCFDHAISCRQIGQLVGLDEQQVRERLFTSGIELEHERGAYTLDAYYELCCEALGTRVPRDELALAASDIFTVNFPVHAVVSQLHAAGYRLGLLSNTNEVHWNFYADGRYAIIPRLFETAALSFRIGALKPEPEIYRAAAELAGVPPEKIFFVDDVPGHVEGAREVGFDAVQYTTTAQLVADLRKRGVLLNY